MTSSLSYSEMITSLENALQSVEWKLRGRDLSYNLHSYSSMIGVRNLISLLVCLRKVDVDGEHLETIHPMLETCKERSGGSYETDAVHATVATVAQLFDHSSCLNLPLELDEIASIIDSAVGNTSDFLTLLPYSSANESTDAYHVLETMAVQMGFIQKMLWFAIEAGVELPSSIMLHIQPIAVKSATVFIKGDTSFFISSPIYFQDFRDWLLEECKSKCLALNRMSADPQVHGAYAQALTACRNPATLPTVDDSDDEEDDILRALLDSIISVLWDLLRSGMNEQFKGLYERLRFSRAILKKNGMDANIRGQIVVLICDAGAFIFLLHQTDPSRFSDLLERFDEFQAPFKLETIPSSSPKADVDRLSIGDSTSIEISDDGFIPPTSSPRHPRTSLPQVVGFKEDELQPLLDRLTRGGSSNELCIVPICGMPGLGKTTLALKLYNHASIVDRFQARAWFTISQEMDRRKTLVQLLGQIQPGGYSSDSEEDLANKLRKSLKGRRYLILLDDIWSTDVWDSLKTSFPNDSNSSRIILTSRCHDIVPDPYLLRLRAHSECFAIMQAKVFHKESPDTQVTELVMKIAEKCHGLPLTVVIVAGLLETSEQESWKGILDDLSVGGVSDCAESALRLSYRHLPDYLQSCLLYFGAFSEDEEVSVKRLIRLWMAEGFVRKSELKRIEDVAREYVDKLIKRSLVMAVKGRSIGGVSSCRIHDTVHDFCRSKAKEENMFHLLQERHGQLSDFNEPCNLQRLLIHSSANHFRETRLFCPRAQSVLFITPGASEEERFYNLKDNAMKNCLLDMSFIIQIFHVLKVLDIYQITLMNDIPSDIGLLTQLRYLAIRTYVAVIPSSLGNLSNLETFIAHFFLDENLSPMLAFPHTLWNLQKLKYLRVSGGWISLPVENLDNSSSLLELETLDGVCFHSDDIAGIREKQMTKFPNVRTLKCRILQWLLDPSVPGSEKRHKIVIPEFLSQLESLSVRGGGGVKFKLSSSMENLVKFKLEGVQVSGNDIAAIGKFPNLEVLILNDVEFPENKLEMGEGEFTKLRILKLISYSIRRWTCSDDQYLCLEKLVLKHCLRLKEIPSLLENISTLKEIEVYFCSSTLDSAVRNIEEVQKGWGNKVQVHITENHYEGWE